VEELLEGEVGLVEEADVDVKSLGAATWGGGGGGGGGDGAECGYHFRREKWSGASPIGCTVLQDLHTTSEAGTVAAQCQHGKAAAQRLPTGQSLGAQWLPHEENARRVRRRMRCDGAVEHLL
jgi:hypothetical protein